MLAYIPAAVFVPPTALPAPTLTLVFASACTLIMLVASLQPQRLNVHAYKAMINTELAISYTSRMFSDQRLQQLCGPHFIPWAQKLNITYKQEVYPFQAWMTTRLQLTGKKA